MDRNLWKLHGRWLLATVVAALAAIGWTIVAAIRSGRWPGGGSLSGLVLGSLAGAIFLFELALVAKKTKPFRTARWLLSAQTWMKAHIWLGLLTVPLVILHSGGRLGGTLTTLFVLVFAVVIASGIWGLALQNLLPRLLLEAAPAETVYSQIQARRPTICRGGTAAGDCRLRRRRRQSGRALSAATLVGCSWRSGAANCRRRGMSVRRYAGRRIRPANVRAIVASPPIQNALERDITPFLESGKAEGTPLGSRQRNEWYFEDLRLRVEPELRTLVDQLEELCERRRQLNVQRRLHFWLHNWLWLHLPLSDRAPCSADDSRHFRAALWISCDPDKGCLGNRRSPNQPNSARSACRSIITRVRMHCCARSSSCRLSRPLRRLLMRRG